MKTVKIVCVALFVLALSGSCTKGTSTPDQTTEEEKTEKLQIKGLSASSACVDDVVNIYGTGFSETPAENIVTVKSSLDSSNAVVVAATKTCLKIRIPIYARFGENNIRVMVKGEVVNYPIYIIWGIYATIRHDLSDPRNTVNALAVDQRLTFLRDGTYYALPIDNDSCENIIYYPPTSEVIGITVKNKMVKYNIITRQISVISLAYPANVYLEGVVVANDTLYAFKKGNSIKQLVTLDVKTGREMTAVDLNIPGNSYNSLVYYPASDEIMGLSADYKKLIRFNTSTHAVNTVVLSSESYIDYMALVVKGNILYAHKRINANPPYTTVVYNNLGTINPVNGSFSNSFDISTGIDGNFKHLFYQYNSLIGTTNTNMVYIYDLDTNLFSGILLGSQQSLSFSGVVSNDLPVY